MLKGLDIETGIDLETLVDAGAFISEVLGTPAGVASPVKAFTGQARRMSGGPRSLPPSKVWDRFDGIDLRS